MGYTPADSLNLEILTGRLITASTQLSELWRTERNYREYIDNLISQLTVSKKEQAKLRMFADRLPDFHTYLLS